MQVTPLDYGVLVFYFCFLASIGWITRRFVHNTSDYFRGGGQMLWWMAGASAFMNMFSAWTFTGGASRAYTDGTNILWIYLGNAVGFFACALYFAPKMRQLRVITPMEAVRQRFGPANEQFFTWISLPTSVIYAGLWLNGLAVFLHAVFGFDLKLTIIVTGLIVVFNSTIGGSWAVVSSDFMQTLILMLIALTAAIYSLVSVGGIGEIVREFPTESWAFGNGINYPLLAVLWIFLMFFKQFTATNGVLEAPKYLYAKDSRHARWAAWFAGALMLVGPVIWFIPPMVARIQHPDLAAMFPSLKDPSEAAFVVMALKTLPSGMIGLLIAGMFAATISSTDSGLNRNAGIFVRNFYRPILRPNASEGEQLIAGKLATLGFGGVIILSGLFLNNLKDLSLFDLMQQFSALVSVPVTIPLILMVFVRRTPDWSAWSTVVLGLVISWFSRFVFPGAWWNATFDLSLSAREVNDWDAVQGLVLGATILPMWFLFTRRFYREPTGQRKVDEEIYWENLATPVHSGDETAKMDGRQGAVLGGLAGAYGLFVLLLALVPNPIAGRLAFVGFGCALIGLGALLYRAYNRGNSRESRE
ncbi:MAG TPA: hypothetical protein VMM36_14225 [Opitutaceae bacterium]|nr:hypothetical protein [Opitutaceae bacterium]